MEKNIMDAGTHLNRLPKSKKLTLSDVQSVCKYDFNRKNMFEDEKDQSHIADYIALNVLVTRVLLRI